MKYPRPYDKVVIAAIRWHENRKECRRLTRALRPCEEEVVDIQGDAPLTPNVPPCWKCYDEIEHPYEIIDGVPYGGTSIVPAPLCPACQHNADHIVPALNAARARRGGLTSALVGAVERFMKEAKT